MENKNNWKAWIYLAPALILMSLLTFFPLINTFVVSLMSDYNAYARGKPTDFSFRNYGVVLGFLARDSEAGTLNKDFLSFDGPSALGNTLLITVITVPVSIAIALAIAIALNHIKPLRNFFQTVFFMPYVTNVIAVGMVFSVLFAPAGAFNKMFGLSIDWVSQNGSTWGSAMFVLCLYIIWNALPYKILIFMSGLQSIDKQYYEAAKIDGASRLKTDFQITVPLLSPQILYISVTSFISAFKEYNAIVGLFGRNYTTTANNHDLNTVVYYIYEQLADSKKIQYASAAAVILFVLIMLFTLVQMQVSKKRVVY
jgi:multiple sugar transport system permease protein